MVMFVYQTTEESLTSILFFFSQEVLTGISTLAEATYVPASTPPRGSSSFCPRSVALVAGCGAGAAGGSKEAREEAPERGPGAEVRRALQELRNLR